MNIVMPTTHKFSDEKVDIILKVFLATSLIAMIAQLFIMIFYYIYVDLRSSKNFAYRLIFFLSCSDVIVWGMRVESNLEKIFTNATANEYSHEFCVFLGFVWNFFLLLNILITFVISFCLVLEVYFTTNSEKYEKYFYLFITIYSLFFSLIPLLNNHAYGVDDQIKCWITDISHSSYRYLGFYAHLWIIFLFNSVNFFIILWKLRSLAEKHIVLVKKLIWFPIIMFIFWLEPSIRRIFDPEDRNFALAVVQYISMPAQGIANAVVYGSVNNCVKEKVKDFFTGKWSNLKQNCASNEFSTHSCEKFELKY